jgi:hypothetical protein
MAKINVKGLQGECLYNRTLTLPEMSVCSAIGFPADHRGQPHGHLGHLWR